ncbi:MAG: sugar transferase [Candidatus Kuenenia sp.]|nr:sugar transferase [Candidatus Kuenenia hertensis]
MRIFDFVVSLTSIIILLPLFLFTAFLIILISPGPVFYSQKRVGRYGRLFNLYKFRTMVVNADQIGTSVTTGSDPRITKVGRYLRKTKIDELPQLLNVLKGDMSFIGPRPDVPEIVNNYSSEMKRILEIKPGITSNASLHLRNEEDILSLAKEPNKAYEDIFVPAKIELAMEHVYRKSVLFDLGVLILTVWILTGGRILHLPTKEHHIVKKIKDAIGRMNNETGLNNANSWKEGRVGGWESGIKR